MLTCFSFVKNLNKRQKCIGNSSAQTQNQMLWTNSKFGALCYLGFFKKLINLLLFLLLFFLIVVDFVIHWNETAMGLHVFPILIPPPTSHYLGLYSSTLYVCDALPQFASCSLTYCFFSWALARNADLGPYLRPIE